MADSDPVDFLEVNRFKQALQTRKRLFKRVKFLNLLIDTRTVKAKAKKLSLQDEAKAKLMHHIARWDRYRAERSEAISDFVALVKRQAKVKAILVNMGTYAMITFLQR